MDERRHASILTLALVLGAGCGAAPAEPVATETPTAVAPAPAGIDLSIELRGRRITVGADGALNAEGCDAARFDWERQALIGLDGTDVAVASPDLRSDTSGVDGVAEPVAMRTIAAPDGTPVVSVEGAEARAGANVLFRFEPDGSLVDAAPGALPASTSGPVGERHRGAVLSLVSLVSLCWETHPRDVVEP